MISCIDLPFYESISYIIEGMFFEEINVTIRSKALVKQLFSYSIFQNLTKKKW